MCDIPIAMTYLNAMNPPAPKAKDLLSDEFRGLVDAPTIDRIDMTIIEQMRVPIPGLGTTRLVERRDYQLAGDLDLTVRLHRPASSSTSDLPCLLALHGGGYVVGSYEMDDTRFECWCPDLGIVGISVQYRLAPETPYPGALDDCYRGLVWAHENSSKLGIDSRRIGVWGASAGGGLAAALALLVRDRGELEITCQVLESPMLDDRIRTSSANIDGLPIWSREANEFAWRCYLGDLLGSPDLPPYAAAARAQDLYRLPPSFVSVGGADGFRDESVDFAMRLSQAGVATELHLYPGAPHGFQMFTDSFVARQNERDVREWLRRFLL